MDEVSVTKVKVKTSVFPRKALQAILRDELMGVAEAEADMNGFTLPKDPGVAAIAPVPMDSLVVVEILCSVEDLLGFQPKDATVRTGGYNSVQDALDHIMPRLEKQWQKKHGETT
ncbi:hypothetical protein [Paracoccus sp. 08]|uniref:hypothetical protein n=1 Tax=Paracoccus sp. 08 TaxID=2606624 RepID=UPI0020948409|nr:hypothetical protein [Paracoccus sp. 08]MCO6364372.1 hypothetical protein [Paracoccus sp. 08]